VFLKNKSYSLTRKLILQSRERKGKGDIYTYGLIQPFPPDFSTG